MVSLLQQLKVSKMKVRLNQNHSALDIHSFAKGTFKYMTLPQGGSLVKPSECRHMGGGGFGQIVI